MGLPIQTAPKYTTVLPSDGREVTFRPFLVKEQKVLVLARESEDQRQQLNAVKDLLIAVTEGECNIDDMYSVDVEWLFLQVRAKSVGEEVRSTFTCGENECDGTGQSILNLEEITVVGKLPEEATVMITEDVGVVLEMAKFKSITDIDSKTTADENVIEIVKKCIVRIFDANQVFERNDMSQDELDEFVDNLSFQQLEKIGSFFDDAPRLTVDVQFKCNKCETVQTKNLQGLQNFF